MHLSSALTTTHNPQGNNPPLACRSSKKYQDLVRKSGEPAPAPIVTLRKVEEAQQAQQPQQAQQAAGFTVKPAVKSAAAEAQQAQRAAEQEAEEEAEDGEADEGSEWETASEEEMETDQKVGRGQQCVPGVRQAGLHKRLVWVL